MSDASRALRRRLSTPLALTLWLAVCALPLGAQAAAGDIVTRVERLSDAVTYARPATAKQPALNPLLAWQISVTNIGGNTVNSVRVQAQVGIGAGPATAPVLSSLDGVDTTRCTTTASGFDCRLGTLRAGAGTSFVVFFAAPLDPGATSTATFSGQTIYGEGENDSPTSPNNSIDAWPNAGRGDPPTEVALGTNNPTLVRSAVSRSGGSLYTGNGGIGTETHPLSASVAIPAGNGITTAELAIAPATGQTCGNFTQCLRADVTIPGSFFPYLTIVLRQSPTNFDPKTKIDSVLIWYEGTDYTGYIGACASPTTPNYDPVTGISIPCIAGRTYYRNRNTPGYTPELDGFFEWRVITVENGGFRML